MKIALAQMKMTPEMEINYQNLSASCLRTGFSTDSPGLH